MLLARCSVIWWSVWADLWDEGTAITIPVKHLRWLQSSHKVAGCQPVTQSRVQHMCKQSWRLAYVTEVKLLGETLIWYNTGGQHQGFLHFALCFALWLCGSELKLLQVYMAILYISACQVLNDKCHIYVYTWAPKPTKMYLICAWVMLLYFFFLPFLCCFLSLYLYRPLLLPGTQAYPLNK